MDRLRNTAASIPPLTNNLPLGNNIDIQSAHHPYQYTYHWGTIQIYSGMQSSYDPYQYNYHWGTI